MKNVSSIKNNKGFTLVELLAVIAVLSIIITIVISIATNIIRKSKEDSYKVTINNVQKEAANYVAEGVTNNKWKDTGIENIQYQCVTVKNLIDAGYFKGDVLESYLSENRKLSATDQIYIERKDSDKTITKNVLLLNDMYSGLCSTFNTLGTIDFYSDHPLNEWKKVKNINIKYTLNNLYDTYVTDYLYTYDFDKDLSAEVRRGFTSDTATSTITINENGTIYATIKGKDNTTLEVKTLEIETIDNEGPVLDISSTNNVSSKQTATFTLSDSGAGVSKYYYGFTHPDNIDDSDWISMTVTKNKTIKGEISESGILYLGARDSLGNETIISKKFYKTTLNITNANVTPQYIITMQGNKFVIPIPIANEYYTFKGWHEDNGFSDSALTSYEPSKDSNLYGNVTENKLVAGDVLITGDAEYGSTLTANINKDTTPKADKYTYQWYTNTSNSISGGTKITGATNNTLVLKEDQVDKYVYVVVTATKNNYKSITFGDITDTTNNKNSKVGKKNVIITADSNSKVYDGTALTDNGCEANGLVFGHTVSCAMTDDSTITDVGSIDNKIKTVLISDKTTGSKNTYYNISYVNGKLTVTSKKVVIPTATNYCNTGLVYNGKEQVLTKNAGTGYTFSNNKFTNAGNYTVTAKLDKNYIWDDETNTNKTFSCGISKKDSSLRLVPTSISMYTGDTNYFSYTYEGDGSLTCSSSNQNIATCSIDTNNKKINVTGKSAGTVDIVLNASEGTNYKKASVKGTAKIEDRIYDVNIYYNVNGGLLNNGSGNASYNWTKDSSGLIYKNGSPLITTVGYTSKLGADALVNWDNSTYLNTIRTGYHVPEGAEWKCFSNNCKKTTYSDTTIYNASDFCDASNSNCSVTLGVNWQPNEYTIKYNANGGTGSMTSHTCTYGESCTIKSNAFTRSGYKFLGFTTKSDGTDDKHGWTGWSGTWKYVYGQYGIASDNTLTLYARWEKIIYNVEIKYSVNGENAVVTNQTTSEAGNVNSWSKDSSGIISKNGTVLIDSIPSNSSLSNDGLVNYNNSKYLNIINSGYHGDSGKEWICISGACTGKTFNQTTSYSASDFCDASNSNCSVTLGVNWVPNTYTIKYNANGGTGSMTSHTCTYGESCTIKANIFTREGYNFFGFTTKSDGTDDGYRWTGWSGIWKYVFGQYGIKEDNTLTLYAMWEKPEIIIYDVNIYYNVNGGSLNNGSGNASYNWTKDSSGLIYKNGTPLITTVGYTDKLGKDGLNNWDNSTYLNTIRTGYHVPDGAEWKCFSNNCKKTTYSDTTVYNASDFCDASNSDCSVTLGVNWVPNEYTIKYNANGGTGSMTSHTCTYGESCTIKSNTFTRSGYKFLGFTTKSDGTDDKHGWTGWSGTWKYVYGQYGIASDNTLTLYARWEKIIYNVNIKYSPIGGTVTSPTISDAGNENYWSIDADGYIIKNDAVLVSTIPSNSSLSNDGLVNYNNGKYLNITKIDYSAVAGAEWKCTFGSCLGKTYNQTTVYSASDFCNADNSDCTVVLGVNWGDGNPYTIKYNANGGTGSMTSHTCAYGSTCSIKSNTFTRNGYTFLGFTTNSDGTDDGYGWTGWSGTWNYINGQNGVSNNTLTLYARWKKINKTIINYNINGGMFKTNASNEGGPFDINDKGVILVNGSILETTIDYGSNTGDYGLVDWDNDSYLSVLKSGYHVADGTEWKCVIGECVNKTYSDSKVYSSSDFCNSKNNDCTVELNVNWVPNTYTIKYNANGGTGSMTSHSCTYGGNCVIKSNSFARSGYRFLGFTTKSDGTDDGYGWTGWSGNWNYVNGQKGVLDNTLTLYARWEKKIYNVEIQYSVNGKNGDVTKQTTSEAGNLNSWSKDSSGLIYKNGELLVTTIASNSSLTGNGLINPYYDKYLQVTNLGYTPYSGIEWICISGECFGETYNQDTLYNASEFCDASNNNCTVTLGVNWTPKQYRIQYNANGGTGSMTSHSCTYGGNCTIKGNTFTRSGYTFLGFTTKSDGTDDGYGWTNYNGSWSFVSGQKGIANDTLTLYARWKENYSTIIKYNVNGGDFKAAVASSSGTNVNWAKDSSGLIYENGNLLTTSIVYGGSTTADGLINWDNSSYLNIARNGYTVDNGVEWKCLSGNCTRITYSDSQSYSSNDFCDSSKGNCEVTLGVNWVDKTAPAITFSQNGSDGKWIKSIKNVVRVSDSGSGIDDSTLRYAISTSSSVNVDTAEVATVASGSTVSGTVQVGSYQSGSTINLTKKDGKYYVVAKACDNASNCTTKVSNVYKLDNTPPVITCDSSKATWVQTMYNSCQAFNSVAGCSLDLFNLPGGATTCSLPLFNGKNPSSRGNCTATVYFANCAGHFEYAECDEVFSATDENGVDDDDKCDMVYKNEDGETSCSDGTGSSCLFKATACNCLDGFCTIDMKYTVHDEAGNSASKIFTYKGMYDDGNYDSNQNLKAIKRRNGCS